MSQKHKSPVDVSRELIVDSIMLTKDVMHSIRNNLPVPLDNVILQKIDASQELGWHRPEPNLRMLLLILFFGLSTVLMVSQL